MNDKIILDIDIETESLTDNKEDALNPHKNRITVIGVKSETSEVQIYRDLEVFKREVWDDSNFIFSGHNLKWDFKQLTHHLGSLPANGYAAYADDTRLMAYVSTDKIGPAWLTIYEERRKALNAELPPGVNHREAGLHSLKTLAPFFLGVDCFWEDPTNHDNDEYLTKDVEYTQQLRLMFSEKLKDMGQYDFYKDKAMPWARTLLQAEVTGIHFDSDLLTKMETELRETERGLKFEIHDQWHEAFKAYEEKQLKELQDKYQEMFEKAYAKPTKKEKNVEALQSKYKALYDKAAASAVTEFNLDSPTQMKWLLRDYLKFDIRTFEGDESTGVEVLERLAKSEPQIKTLLEYRETSKILTGFLPTYREECYQGKMYSTFNFDGTRTGRVNSVRPNLQQTPKKLKPLFRAAPGKKLATYDLGAIEPVILAYFTQDKALCDLIFKGQSFHSINTMTMFSHFMRSDITEPEVKTEYPVLRFIAKTVSLAILYGAGWRRIKAETMAQGIQLSEKQCKDIVYMMRDKYSGVWSFKQDLDMELEKGAVLFNLFGRPFQIDDPDDVYMKGLNRLIQGSASDLCQQAATDIAKIPGCVPVGFIHDSVLTEIDAERSKELCEKIVYEFTKFELPVGDRNLPLTVEGGAADVWE